MTNDCALGRYMQLQDVHAHHERKYRDRQQDKPKGKPREIVELHCRTLTVRCQVEHTEHDKWNLIEQLYHGGAEEIITTDTATAPK